ncbi:MAG TPA: helical backbone metal receptor [Fontimonas sp.]
MLFIVALPAAGEPQQRIVTLAPHLAELVCAVGRCEALVGVAEHSDAALVPAAAVEVGNAFNVNIEAVLALRPTLVLAWAGGTPTQLAERLRGLGIHLEMVQVRRLEEIADALRQVGRATASADGGARAAQDFLQALRDLQWQYRSRSRLRVFYQIETAPTFSVNRDSPISEALNLCGADNVFAGLPTLAAAVSTEAVLAARPQAVVYSRQDGTDAIAAYWARLPGLGPADARMRLAVDGNTLTRQAPSVLRGIAEVCEGLDRIRPLVSSAAR